MVSKDLSLITSSISREVNKVESTVNEAIEKAENTLNKLVNEIAALIVTSIVIPILVFLLFIWIINTFLGTSFKVPKPKKRTFYKKKNELIIND